MFIKKLELLGFKTFAEKTEVAMGHGITAVVGPNGSGKSNISDALLWVLGESNVRNIRGQRATDVIFNGSEKRKALGMAEVSLTLDNTCGTLPINYNEVTVTRRAYKSGESEYFINKTRCRLKDIYELFLDTGIGREAYSMVTQGEIDAILSAKAEDRRELFEEAAGIKKYRYRRDEATRKLGKTETNLLRVCDIMAEIGSQVEPLAQEAERADRYNELQTRLKEIEIGLLIRDLRRFTSALEEVRQNKIDCEGKIEEYDKLLADLEWEKDKQATRSEQLEADVDNARRVQQALAGNLQRLQSKMALLEERLRSAKSSQSQADSEISSIEAKIAETEDRIKRLESELHEHSEKDVRIRAEVETKSKSLEELDKRFDEISRSVNDQKANYLELARELAEKRNALQNAKEHVARLESALQKYQEEIAALEASKNDASDRYKESQAEVEWLEKSIQEDASRIARLSDERKNAQEQAAALAKKYAEISREIAGKTSRLSTLREMAESHEGFYEGVRSVMAAKKAGKIRGEFAVVADVISVPRGYEAAIETALGASLQDVIADTVDESKRAIAFLKENRAGRATFLPLDNMRRNQGDIRGRMDRRAGALGIAADEIKYDEKYDPAIRSLLGRTVLAETIDDAVALSRELSGWNKIVTLEGELILPSGAMTGGMVKSKGPGLLLRKQEIDTLTQEIRKMEKSAAEIQTNAGNTQDELDKIAQDLQKTEKAMSENRIALAEQRRRFDFSSKEIGQFNRQIDTVLAEQQDSSLMLEQETDTVNRLEGELQAVGQENTDLDRKVAGAEQSIEQLQKQRDSERQELMQLNAELAAGVERCHALNNSINDSKNNLAELKASFKLRTKQIDGFSTDIIALETEKDTVEKECVTQKELLAAADKQLDEKLLVRTEELHKTAEIDKKLKEAGNMRNQLSTNSHDSDVKEARLEVQANQAKERLFEEYEMTYEQAMEWPEDEIEVERGTATEVARIRREIKDMGPVNTGAVQEYQRVKERWDFLTEQRTDLESAKEQINSAINEIDLNTRGLFMETFTKVVENFDIMFKRLFGGGKTSLTLTDPGNLLQTGVNVDVQVPGKKLQDLSLLSGGERALTATALIFALLMVKPSPFVVMDEVDAPLDESNVERFAEVLKHFAEKSQFIVITHNRATMEAASSLYGVTMQEPGISKLLSVKLTTEGVVKEGTESALSIK